MSSTKIMKQKVASAKKSVLPGSGRRAKVVTDAQKWLTRIDRAKKVRNEWKTKFRVALAYEYLEGQVKPLGVPDNDWICINMIFSILRSLLPTYYQTDPYFYIKLKRSFKPNPMMIALYEMKADGRQSLLNYLKGELNLKQKMRLAIFDALFQYGVVKTHAAADLVENTSKGEPLEDDEGNTLYDPDTNQPIMQPEMLPANEAYSITRVHPDDLLVDEDAGPLEEDIQWIAQRIRRRVDEVRDDKRYTADVRKTVQPTEITDQDEKAKEYRKKGKALSDSEEPAGDVVVTWEIYDLKKKEWLTVAEGCDEFLTDPDDIPKGIERHPFSFLRFFLRDATM